MQEVVVWAVVNVRQAVEEVIEVSGSEEGLRSGLLQTAHLGPNMNTDHTITAQFNIFPTHLPTL